MALVALLALVSVPCLAQQRDAIHDGYRERTPVALVDPNTATFTGALRALRECPRIDAVVSLQSDDGIIESSRLKKLVVQQLAAVLPNARFGDAGSENAHIRVLVMLGSGVTKKPPISLFTTIVPCTRGDEPNPAPFGGVVSGETFSEALTQLADQLVQGDTTPKR